MLVALYSNGRRAGKDTTAEHAREWCELHDLAFERLAFADRMKQLVALSLGIGGDDLVHYHHPASTEGEALVLQRALDTVDQLKLSGQLAYWLAPQGTDPEDVISGRDFIINLAEGCRVLLGADIWVDQILPRGWAPTADYTFITDLRFPEEANRVAELGGVVLEIKNPRAEDAGGRSEGALDPIYIDGQIDNSGDLDSLRAHVDQLMTQLSTQKLKV